MDISKYVLAGIETAKEHSGTIFAGFAIGGVIITSVESGKAAVVAAQNKPATFKEKVKTYWKPVLSGLVTIGCIVASDRIHVGQTAAATALGTLWRDRYTELNHAVNSTLPKEQADEVHKASVAKSKERADKLREASKLRVYFPQVDQYVDTSREKLFLATSETNTLLRESNEAELNYFVTYCGGYATLEGNRLRWAYADDAEFTIDDPLPPGYCKSIEPIYDVVKCANDEDCLVVYFYEEPVPAYDLEDQVDLM